VRIDVHDIAGRLVRLLDIGRLSAGRHQATWDARTNDGTRIRAGVYLVGLEIDGHRLGAKRVVIVR
jgi:flagellar hook assembly protein FlgD